MLDAMDNRPFGGAGKRATNIRTEKASYLTKIGRSDFGHASKPIVIKWKNSWLRCLDAFRTICIDSKGEIQSVFEKMRSSCQFAV